MIKRLFALLCAFIISISFMCQSSLTVYASDILTEEDKDALEDGSEFAIAIINKFWLSIPKIENAMRLMFGQIGLWLNQDKWSEGRLYDMYCEYLIEKAIIEDSETYDDYLKAHIKVNANENEVTSVEADSELMNTLYAFSVDVIENECGWYECQTLDYRNYPATNFDSQGLYNTFISYCTQNIKGTDNTVFVGGFSSKSVDDGNGGTIALGFMYITESLENLEYYNYSGGNVAYITQDWSTFNPSLSILYDGGEIENGSFFVDRAWFRDDCSRWDLYRHTPITDGSKTVRVYKSLEDLKSYSVGQRPYYATSDFYNYDSSQDNSVTLTGSDLSNGSVYGDVYNYIINNYDNSDGLTEDELRDILDDYFNNSGGGSGSSGNDSGSGSGSSGSGFLGFLDGLGSLGDAILGILGKLIEYIGKAIDLIVNGLTDIIDKIPKNVTNLIAAMFPFLPEEFFTAIELALILGVVCIVIKIFK